MIVPIYRKCETLINVQDENMYVRASARARVCMYDRMNVNTCS